MATTTRIEWLGAVRGSMSATFSECRQYRYALFRSWANADVQPGHTAVFIGLNPSTADETQDDPTIRRCIGFAKRWGYDTLIMLNLFAWRSTDPAGLRATADPVGKLTDTWIKALTKDAGVIVAAWGTHGSLHGRDRAVLDLLARNGRVVQSLGLTKGGHPRHPLYLPADAPLVGYRALAREE